MLNNIKKQYETKKEQERSYYENFNSKHSNYNEEDNRDTLNEKLY